MRFVVVGTLVAGLVVVAAFVAMIANTDMGTDPGFTDMSMRR